MQLLLQQAIQLVYSLMGFLSIQTTESMLPIEKMGKFKYGSTIVSLRQEQFLAIR